MNSLIRVCCLSNQVRPARPDVCLSNILEGLELVRESTPDILLLPAFSLCPASCGGLYRNASLLDAAKDALDELCLATAAMPCYVVAGLVTDDWGKPAPVCAVLYKGRVVGLTPSHSGPALPFDGRYSDQVLPDGAVFSIGGCRFTVASCSPQELMLYAAHLQESGCDLVLCPACIPVQAGVISDTRRAMRLISKTLGCAVALCNGGTGDSTGAFLYNGFAGIYECGEEIRFISHKNVDHAAWGESVMADVDMDIVAACKRGGAYVKPVCSVPVEDSKKGILRRIVQNPFLCASNRDAYVGELFSLQVASLMGRLQNTGIKRLVVGVSGGLDSTLALLVAAKAMDCLGLPRCNVLAVTMPGFGTSGRTYRNAVALMERLGCDTAEIAIGAACKQHFADIGQDPECHDLTFENAQARERCQVLFDLANRAGALVLGTGDLSEEALGWCTFGGDHLSGYNVNVCLTKNMIRAVVKYAADSGIISGALPGESSAGQESLSAALNLKKPQTAIPPLSMTGSAPQPEQLAIGAVLRDILATPVSPELIPGKNGEIAQKSEEILGSYDLHDFFTYYFVRYGFRPVKLFRYACLAFGTQVEPPVIKERLLLFLRRFFAGQFKRSCAPDAASITEVNLLPGTFHLPSDGDAKLLLEEVEQIQC